MAATTTIDVKKTRFSGVGWAFDESLSEDTWQVIAKKASRTIVSRSHDRQAAWRAVFEKIDDSSTDDPFESN